jgi:hypothetical protein
MKMCVALISGLLIAAPAYAQGGSTSVSGSGGELATQNESTESSGQGAQGADGERRICRRVETGSQSRMTTRRVCRTAEEWRESQRVR